MAKIRKATEQEKTKYDESGDALHPLFGFVKISGVEVAVEYLGEGKGEPNYEAIAPDGWHFNDGDILHTVLGTTQADLTGRLGTLEKCYRECYRSDEEYEAAQATAK